MNGTPAEPLEPDEIMNSHLPPRADQLPSTELISGSPIGVGSLPGKRSEQRVALTPEERLHPAGGYPLSFVDPHAEFFSRPDSDVAPPAEDGPAAVEGARLWEYHRGWEFAWSEDREGRRADSRGEAASRWYVLVDLRPC